METCTSQARGTRREMEKCIELSAASPTVGMKLSLSRKGELTNFMAEAHAACAAKNVSLGHERDISGWCLLEEDKRATTSTELSCRITNKGDKDTVLEASRADRLAGRGPARAHREALPWRHWRHGWHSRRSKFCSGSLIERNEETWLLLYVASVEDLRSEQPHPATLLGLL